MEKKIYKTEYRSPIGDLTLASDGESLIGLWIEGQKISLDESKMLENNRLEVFCLTKKWLDEYFCGKRPDASKIPLAPIGNEFRQGVWKILRKIPYGKTTTYGEIAAEIAQQRGLKRMSAQAVGGAVGHNPISIIVPCHRVVGKNGNLTGYAGGIELKTALLKLENADMTKFFLPKK